MAVLASSGVSDLRQKFYELLTDFSTFPASQNFFLVNIKHIPESITEATVNELGLRPGVGETTGLDFAKNVIFKKYFDSYMFLATGVDLTTETTSVNNRGTLINGLLPVGPFMESRDYPDNDLEIQFSETNISIIDSIFRSWIQLYSVYGNIVAPEDQPLSTDISIYFISKQTEDSGFWSNSDPAITKIYTYKDCIPYIIKSANIGQYNGDVELGSVAVGFRFSRYDVRIPVQGYVPPPPPPPPYSERDAIARIPEEALYGSGEQPYDFTGEVPIYPEDYVAMYDKANPPPDVTTVVAGTVVHHYPQAPPYDPTPAQKIADEEATRRAGLTPGQKIAAKERQRREALRDTPNVPATRKAMETGEHLKAVKGPGYDFTGDVPIYPDDAKYRARASKNADDIDDTETKKWETQDMERLKKEGTGIKPINWKDPGGE